MDITRLFSRRSFILIMFFTVILFFVVKSALYFGLDAINEKVLLLIKSEATLPEIKMIASQISMDLYHVKFSIIPISTGIFALFGFLLWFFLRVSLVKLLKEAQPSDLVKNVETTAKAVSKKNKGKDDDR
jgi:hypothetical protein